MAEEPSGEWQNGHREFLRHAHRGPKSDQDLLDFRPRRLLPRASHPSLLIPPDSVDACDIEIGGDSENRRRLQRYLRTSFCDNLASKLHDSSENIFHFILLLKRSMILIELLPLGIRVDRGNGIEIEDSMKEGMKVSRAGNAVEKILDR